MNNEPRTTNLVSRDTLHASRDTISSPERQATSDEIASTSVENALQIAPFMQNKANFLKSQMNVNPYNTTVYENKPNWTLGENKPNTKPIKANLPDDQMNVNKVLTKDYRK